MTTVVCDHLDIRFLTIKHSKNEKDRHGKPKGGVQTCASIRGEDFESRATARPAMEKPRVFQTQESTPRYAYEPLMTCSWSLSDMLVHTERLARSHAQIRKFMLK